jgi:hypothetical protein
MKQVFLIHAHKDLDQLNALVAQLCDADFAIYVHLDRKWKVDTSRVHPCARQVEPRVNVRWGGFSQVAAMLASLRRILASEPEFDKLIFLSAQDFPVLSNRPGGPCRAPVSRNSWPKSTGGPRCCASFVTCCARTKCSSIPC